MNGYPRFPIGKFSWPQAVTEADLEQYITRIATLPANLAAAVEGLTDAQLETPYREGGWSVRQVVHHVPESHMNAYIRFKLALTEEKPAIKPYDEDGWARLNDVGTTPVAVSLRLTEALHTRWVNLMQGMSPADWKRVFVHPVLGEVPLERNAALYAWHGDHHVAHVTELRTRMGW